MSMPIRSHLIASFACLLLAVGCQPKPSTVTGVVTLDGKPAPVGSDSRGTVVFQPAGGQGSMATGVLDSKGHFALATGASPIVSPGKYQVAISVVELLPRTEQAERGGKRLTPAKYSSAIDSGLQAEVVPGPNEFKFDLISGTNSQFESDDPAALEPESSTSELELTPDESHDQDSPGARDQ